MKRPASQFYWGDWLNCQELRAVSLAARGLWIDMLCFMRQGNPIGHLSNNATGAPITPEQLARMVGESADRVHELLRELEEAGVPSRGDNGAYVSRRMMRDEVAYEAYLKGQAAAGKRGASKRWKLDNPQQPYSKPKGRDEVAHDLDRQPHTHPSGKEWGDLASSSSPSSPSSKEEEGSSPGRGGVIVVVARGKHAHCHPRVCAAGSETVRQCMPRDQAKELANKLARGSLDERLEKVIRWALADVPPASYVSPSSDYLHWRQRWDSTLGAVPITHPSGVPSEAETIARYG